MIMKRVFFIAAVLFIVAAANAEAQTVNVNHFVVNNLWIAPGAYLNLDSADSYGIVRIGYPLIETYIKNGYAGGDWNGSGGISSSVAAADPNKATALALISGQDYMGYCWNSGDTPTFFGNIVHETDSLIRFTYYGDANMDGVVDENDYAFLESAVASGGPAAGYSGWVWGDFNYDGAIDDLDVNLFNKNYELNHPPLVSVATYGTLVWKGGNTANWAVGPNWDPGMVIPNRAGVKVRFGDQSSGNNIVDMVTHGETVGTITFTAASSTTIKSTGGYSLTLDNSSQPSTIDVAGSHTISAPVVLNNDAVILGPGMLSLTGGITGNQTLTVLGNLTASSIRVDTLVIGNASMAAVPEPSSIALLCTGAFGVLACAWRRERKTV
jgi:hypothetical protein